MGAPSNVFAKFMTIPLLGPVYLATMAKNLGYDAAVMNENILKRGILDSELQKADILCLSCITATVDRGKEIAARYRKARERYGAPAHVIIGGIHASMLPDDVSGHFDQVVCGEAESILPDLLEGKLNEHIIKGERISDLDTVPVPDFSLLQGWRKINVWPVMTSRGCPHLCNFCSVSIMFGRGYRFQSASRVINEIERHRKGWVFFVDDNFTVQSDRTHELLEAIMRSRFNQPWTAQVRTEVAKNSELVKKMRRAGCRIVYIGLESINPESLTKMEKKQTIEDIQRSVKIFQSNDIQVHGMFMLGHDPDTPEIFKATSEFSRKSRLSYVQFSVLTPLPGTEVFTQLEREGRLLHRKWSLYDGLHVVFRPRNMSAAELQMGMLRCFNRFYSLKNALRDYIRATPKGIKSLGDLILMNTARLHCFYPAFMKWIGKIILHKWLKQNKAYLTYLEKLKHGDTSAREVVMNME